MGRTARKLTPFHSRSCTLRARAIMPVKRQGPPEAVTSSGASSYQVPSARLERATYCLGGSRSIHLSYEGKVVMLCQTPPYQVCFLAS